MKKQATLRLLIWLVLPLLLPVVLFLLYELFALNEQEKLLVKVYQRQLEAVLFSANLYADDVVSAMANRVETLDLPAKTNGLSSFLEENFAVQYIFCSDTSLREVALIHVGPLDTLPPQPEALMTKWLAESEGETRKMCTYLEGGYRKILPFPQQDRPNQLVLLFISQSLEKGLPIVVGLVIHPDRFVEDVMRVRLSQLAQEDITLQVLYQGYVSYSTDELNNGYQAADETPSALRKALWLLPGYELGVSLKSGSVGDLAKNRTFNTVLIFGAATALILLSTALAFRNVRKELELAQIRSDLVANVSHELRTPLALISMFAETLVLNRIRNDEQRQKYHRLILQETGRLSGIVSRLLHFSRIESGKMELQLAPADLNELVTHVLETYRFHLENEGFSYQFEAAPDLPTVQVDESAMTEVLVNLLDNAVKYSTDRKQITLRTGRSGRDVFIEIADKGIGISPKDQKRIFEKFFRVTSGEVHNTKGAGMGLSIVKHVVEKHQGRIEVESQLGQGSTFRILLPASA